MKHVLKQERMGCAVATAAMLADLTYEEAAARRPNKDAARLRWPQELCALLKSVTDTAWQVKRCWCHRVALSRFAFPQWPVAVFLQDAPFFPRWGQWVVVKRDIVHDPGEWTVYTVNSYPRRDWRVVCVAQPTRPAEFARNQARRHRETVRHVFELEGLSMAEPATRSQVR